MTRLLLLALALLAGTPPARAQAAGPAAPAEAASAPAQPDGALDARAQALKAQVLQLNRDLLVLEEELLYPASSQVAVFVSMDVGQLFGLESVQVKLDDKVVAQHLYTEREVAALQRGGVQRLWLGNLKAGTHEVTAFFTGQGPHVRDYRRATTLSFDKAGEARYIELRITDRMTKLQPEFDVKVWQ